MFEGAYSLLSLFDEIKKVHGRKKVQKMVHLLESAGLDLPFKYEYHFYGPYSAELQEEINTLVQQGFLTESKNDEAYVYSITKKGKAFKETLEADGGYSLKINTDLLNSMVKESSQFLEMVSTYAFLIDLGYDTHKAKSKAIELKPHLEKLIDEAIAFYDQKVN
ncbi:MAG: hypothetical protein H0Z33_13940 [Bacillaceae bacterium]|nr:hypothetical protein [Bacillaceae bacterium]